MFGSLSTKLTEQLIDAQARAAELRLRVSALETTNDWFRVRITQLEHERALLMQHYMGVSVPVPEIVDKRAGAPSLAMRTMPSIFDDIGETEAQRLGIHHADDGTLRYDTNTEDQTHG